MKTNIFKALCFVVVLICAEHSFAQKLNISACDECFGMPFTMADSILASNGLKTEYRNDSVAVFTDNRNTKTVMTRGADDAVSKIEIQFSCPKSEFISIAAELSSRSYPSMMSCLFWQTLVVLNQTDSLMFLDGTIGSMKASRMREDYVRGKIGKEQFEAFAQHYCGTQMTYSRFLNAMVEYMGATMIAQISETMTRGNSAWVVKADKKKKKILVKYIRSSESRESLQRQLKTE